MYNKNQFTNETKGEPFESVNLGHFTHFLIVGWVFSDTILKWFTRLLRYLHKIILLCRGKWGCTMSHEMTDLPQSF